MERCNRRRKFWIEFLKQMSEDIETVFKAYKYYYHNSRKGILFASRLYTNYTFMEKRIFGIILTVLGIAGLIWAAYNFVQGPDNSNYDIKAMWVYCILRLIFFFSGIGLIRNTRDKTA